MKLRSNEYHFKWIKTKNIYIKMENTHVKHDVKYIMIMTNFETIFLKICQNKTMQHIIHEEKLKVEASLFPRLWAKNPL